MEFEVGVLYKSALARYKVAAGEQGWIAAELLSYKGGSEHDPPAVIVFRKEGRHCSGNVSDQELLDDLYYAVRMKMQEAI